MKILKKLFLVSLFAGINLVYAQNPQVTGLALSGQKDIKISYEFENYDAWKIQQKNLPRAWQSFDKNILSKERLWAKDNLNNNNLAKISLLFYPFSGPDITHPLQFFPDATQYLLFGLEPVGTLLDVENTSEVEFSNVVSQINSSTSEVIGRNFFRTIDMAKQIKTNNSGVASILTFFLALNNNKIDNVNIINSKEYGVPGVDIQFTTAEGVKKSLTYWNADISNSGLAKHSKFVQLLESKLQQPNATMIKAASYLMWNNNFSKIKNLVLDKSEYILMDSSAFKINNFSDQWKVQHFGNYIKPINLFKGYLDNDLKQYFIENKSEKLPFYYGYSNGNISSNLIWATKK